MVQEKVYIVLDKLNIFLNLVRSNLTTGRQTKGS